MKVAVVLFNLGGPDSLDAVEPFLRNLFSDRAVIDLPSLLRIPLAIYAARRRAPVAREIYVQIGGASPINAQTEQQAAALEHELQERNVDARCFVAMRCWRPFIADTVDSVRQYSPDTVVLLPLYPQYSTTTTASSLNEWKRAATAAGLLVPQMEICCYPTNAGFIDALAARVRETLTGCEHDVDYRVLLSAHGLPKRTIAKGDPYCWQVSRTAESLIARLGMTSADWRLTFQSRVGPLQWVGPATDSEIHQAARDGKGVVVVPIAFVSEHSETLVELDIEYARLARECGVRDYRRVLTVGVHSSFISGLADLVAQAQERGAKSGGALHACPSDYVFCHCAQGN